MKKWSARKGNLAEHLRPLCVLMLMTTLASLLLSACGSNTATNTTAANPTIASSSTTAPSVTTAASTSTTAAAKATTAASVAATTAPAKSNVTLRMLTPLFATTAAADGRKFLGDMLAKFKEETGITVNVEYLNNYTGLEEKLSTAFASGLPYDVFNIGLGWVEPFAKNLLPLDDLNIDTADYFDNILAAGKYQGKLLAIPYVMDTRIMVYRKDFFKEAGLDPNKPPTNWDELRDYAIKLTKRGSDGTLERAGFDVTQTGAPLNESPRSHWYRFLWQNGGELFNSDGTKAIFNSEAGVEALQFWVDMVRKHKVTDVGFNSGQQGVSLISQGRAGMATINMQTLSQQVEKNPDLKDKIGVIPPMKKVKQSEFVGGSFWSIAKNSKYPDEAKRLVKFLITKENMLAGNKFRKAIPPLKSLMNDPYVQSDFLIQAGIENLKVAKSEGGSEEWLEIRNLFDPAITEAVVGTKTPKQALDDMAAKANEILAKRK